MDPRFAISTVKIGNGIDIGEALLPTMTHHYDDESFGGVWAHPTERVLTFSDNAFAAPFVYHGGPVGGISTPVRLIFWGNWWLTADGVARRDLVITRTQAMLNSHYFDQLDQYYIATPPVWGGDAKVVIEPGPPGAVSANDAQDAVLDMVDNLIDDGEFGDPDDGPRIAFIVCMPPGFVCTRADGAHKYDYDWDFPFDTDNYWAGWCRYYDPAVEDVETMMQTIAHEIVEMITDPEIDGWHTDLESDATGGEIADIALSMDGSGGQVWQSAWVNDVNVQAYWSNRHNATVIPIDQDYGARITGTSAEVERSLVQEGGFRPEASDSAACSTSLPECCIDDREYWWAVYDVTAAVRLELDIRRYRDPLVSWTINGLPAVGNNPLTVTVDYDQFNGRETTSANGPIDIHFNEHGRNLDITVTGSQANFDLEIACTVTEGAITGNPTSRLAATTRITAGVVGAVLEVEQAYIDQKSDCLTAMLRRYIEQHVVTGRGWRQRGINYEKEIGSLVLPGYAHFSQYLQARQAAKAAHAAYALLEPEHARVFVDDLIAGIPALAGAMNRRQVVTAGKRFTAARFA
ncbi:hypothetical protein [Mycobacterium sp. URHB0044]|uniref:hypothetical protein n=1 Tax=Mycobacterium sp. URHB0044 TaxID=1380386 RepID=UPI00048D3879|nr:hypothetical protein [Mycobacterium sp. URHB0044]